MKKTKNFKATLKRVILQIFKEYTIESILIITLSILSTIFNIYGPKILGKATTEIFKGIINNRKWIYKLRENKTNINININIIHICYII